MQLILQADRSVSDFIQPLRAEHESIGQITMQPQKKSRKGVGVPKSMLHRL